MRVGWLVSLGGHVVLVTALLAGTSVWRTPLPPVELAEVTVISEEEFALLTRPEEGPAIGAGARAPAPPEASEAPAVPRQEAAPPAAEAPRSTETEEPDAVPEDRPGPLAPETQVVDAPPQTVAPAVQSADPPDAPALAEPAPQAAPRIAPEAAPPPPPEAETAPETVEATAPGPAAETPAEPETASAPEAAATEIVTEAEEGDTAAALPPRSRPERVEPAPQDPGRTTTAASSPAPPPEMPSREDAVVAALSEALSGAPETAPRTGAAAGPPLTSGERDALRLSVQRCWNVGSLSTDAMRTTVVVGVRLTRDAKPDTASIEMLGYQGGDATAARQAFEAARRAIIRCGTDGFPLPPEKYDRWAQVEMTFNPNEMRIR